MKMTTLPTEIAALATRVRSVVEHEERIAFVYLFGSVARGDARDDSDVDLAVHLSEDLSLLEEASLHGHHIVAAEGFDQPKTYAEVFTGSGDHDLPRTTRRGR